MRRYYRDAAFRDRVISQAQNRRVDKLGLEGITRPAQLVGYLLDRDEGVCGLCGELVEDDTGLEGPSIGHIVPLARGGAHALTNIRLEHLRCNLRKGSKLDEELAA